MINVEFKQGSSSKLPSSGKEGTFYVTTDTHDMYLADDKGVLNFVGGNKYWEEFPGALKSGIYIWNDHPDFNACALVDRSEMVSNYTRVSQDIKFISDGVEYDYMFIEYTGELTYLRLGYGKDGEIETSAYDEDYRAWSGTLSIIEILDASDTDPEFVRWLLTQTKSADQDLVDRVLANNSWETISRVAAAGEARNYWNLGDTTNMFLYDGSAVECVIVGFDHDGDNTITFATYTPLLGHDNTHVMMSDSHANYEFPNTHLNSTIEGTLSNYVDYDFSSKILKLVEKEYTKNDNVSVETYNTRMFPFSVTELFGDREFEGVLHNAEGSQYEWFSNNVDNTCFSLGSAAYWTRTLDHLVDSGTPGYMMASDGSARHANMQEHANIIVGFVV